MLLKKTETVKFDPAKKEHREAFKAYRKRNAWSDSPIRFSYDPEYGSVAAQVQTKLLNWYLDKETNRKVKKAIRRTEMQVENKTC